MIPVVRRRLPRRVRAAWPRGGEGRSFGSRAGGEGFKTRGGERADAARVL